LDWQFRDCNRRERSRLRLNLDLVRALKLYGMDKGKTAIVPARGVLTRNNHNRRPKKSRAPGAREQTYDRPVEMKNQMDGRQGISMHLEMDLTSKRMCPINASP